MHIRATGSATPVTTPHGEIVRELGGISAGGLTQHSLAHITLPPQQASLKHYHPEAEESYYIISGSGQVIINGEKCRLNPGEMIAIAPGQIHEISNPSPDESLTFIAICTPPWTPDCSVFVED